MPELFLGCHSLISVNRCPPFFLVCGRSDLGVGVYGLLGFAFGMSGKDGAIFPFMGFIIFLAAFWTIFGIV